MEDQLFKMYIPKFKALFKMHHNYGRITAKELGKVMSVYGLDKTRAELQDMINEEGAGADRNGTIDLTGFLYLMARMVKGDYSGSGPTYALKDLDKDQKGKAPSADE
ncbi:unnamed protein product [Eruca vesicaria subsp. sativa]|uniref:EF-hand domain-containing protein n=1 Tax=Eruca vesicaria subsp. sativa TaxID=29727 RepID=A0ABC8IZ27_ERUVS|nr:unnamed protein product [Eruca vesicaria subsp. sativa]